MQTNNNAYTILASLGDSPILFKQTYAMTI